MTNQSLTIADTGCLVDHSNGPVIYWNVPNGVHANPITLAVDLVQAEPEIVKDEFIEWLGLLGGQRLNGIELVRQLNFDNNCSFWWLMATSQADNIGKSGWINDALKIIAIKRHFERHHFSSICVISRDIRLIRCLRKLSNIWGVDFKLKANFTTRALLTFPNFFLYQAWSLLARIKGFIWLLYFISSRLKFKKVGVDKFQNTQPDLVFISFYANLDTGRLAMGSFESGYWGELPMYLESSQRSVAWVHLVPFENTPIFNKSLKTDLLNANLHSKQQISHLVLESFLSFKVIFEAIRAYLTLQPSIKKARRIVEHSSVNELNFWHFLRKEWVFEAAGRPAIQNLLNFFMIKRLISKLGRKTKVIFLQENQSYEYSLLQLCTNHEQTFGFPHSSIRFWDLRYATIGRECTEGAAPRPSPNKVIANGDQALHTFTKAGKAPSSIERATSLRHMDLMRSLERPVENSVGENKLFERILVLGDYDIEANAQLMKILYETTQKFPGSQIKLKEHPITPLAVDNFLGASFQKSNGSLIELIRWCNVVVSGETTTAALDCYLFGKPVVVVVSGNSVIKSPLLGLPAANFVSNSSELSTVLSKRKLKVPVENTKNFFYFSRRLSDWREFLNL